MEAKNSILVAGMGIGWVKMNANEVFFDASRSGEEECLG